MGSYMKNIFCKICVIVDKASIHKLWGWYFLLLAIGISVVEMTEPTNNGVVVVIGCLILSKLSFIHDSILEQMK